MDQQERRARLVAVASGKGGVGKSSISLNLAVRLAQMGRQVLLIDADLGTANADVLCNVTSTYNIAHVIAGRCTIQDAIVTGPGGFKLLTGASGLASAASLNEFERLKLVQQLRALQEQFDLMIIDTAAGISPNVLNFAASADQLLVVTTPEPTAITDAYAVIKTVHRKRPEQNMHLLVNMVRDEADARQVHERIDAVCRRFLKISPGFAGHVVYDARVPMATRHRKPFVIDSPAGDASACVGRLAHRIDRGAAEPSEDRLLRRMASWLVG